MADLRTAYRELPPVQLDAPQMTADDLAVFKARGETPFIRGLKAGGIGLSAASNAYDALRAEAAGDLAKSTMLRDRAQEGAREAALVGPEITTSDQIHGVGNAFDYAAGHAGQALATTMPALAGAVIGRGALGGLGRAGTLLGAARGAGPVGGGLRAAGAIPGPVAAGIGAFPAAYIPEAGEAALTQYNDPESMLRSAAERERIMQLKGVGGALLESAMPALGVSRIFGAAAPAAKRLTLRSGAAQIGEGMLGEGATEIAQEAVGQVAHSATAPKRDTSGDLRQLFEAGLAGAVGGGGLATGGVAAQGVVQGVGKGAEMLAAAGQAARDKAEVAATNMRDRAPVMLDSAKDALRDSAFMDIVRMPELNLLMADNKMPPEVRDNPDPKVQFDWLENLEANKRAAALKLATDIVNDPKAGDMRKNAAQNFLDNIDDPSSWEGVGRLAAMRGQGARIHNKVGNAIESAKNWASKKVDEAKPGATQLTADALDYLEDAKKGVPLYVTKKLKDIALRNGMSAEEVDKSTPQDIIAHFTSRVGARVEAGVERAKTNVAAAKAAVDEARRSEQSTGAPPSQPKRSALDFALFDVMAKHLPEGVDPQELLREGVFDHHKSMLMQNLGAPTSTERTTGADRPQGVSGLREAPHEMRDFYGPNFAPMVEAFHKTLASGGLYKTKADLEAGSNIPKAQLEAEKRLAQLKKYDRAVSDRGKYEVAMVAANINPKLKGMFHEEDIRRLTEVLSRYVRGGLGAEQRKQIEALMDGVPTTDDSGKRVLVPLFGEAAPMHRDLFGTGEKDDESWINPRKEEVLAELSRSAVDIDESHDFESAAGRTVDDDSQDYASDVESSDQERDRQGLEETGEPKPTYVFQNNKTQRLWYLNHSDEKKRKGIVERYNKTIEHYQGATKVTPVVGEEAPASRVSEISARQYADEQHLDYRQVARSINAISTKQAIENEYDDDTLGKMLEDPNWRVIKVEPATESADASDISEDELNGLLASTRKHNQITSNITKEEYDAGLAGKQYPNVKYRQKPDGYEKVVTTNTTDFGRVILHRADYTAESRNKEIDKETGERPDVVRGDEISISAQSLIALMREKKKAGAFDERTEGKTGADDMLAMFTAGMSSLMNSPFIYNKEGQPSFEVQNKFGKKLQGVEQVREAFKRGTMSEAQWVGPAQVQKRKDALRAQENKQALGKFFTLMNTGEKQMRILHARSYEKGAGEVNVDELGQTFTDNLRSASEEGLEMYAAVAEAEVHQATAALRKLETQEQMNATAVRELQSSEQMAEASKAAKKAYYGAKRDLDFAYRKLDMINTEMERREGVGPQGEHIVSSTESAAGPTRPRLVEGEKVTITPNTSGAGPVRPRAVVDIREAPRIGASAKGGLPSEIEEMAAGKRKEEEEKERDYEADTGIQKHPYGKRHTQHGDPTPTDTTGVTVQRAAEGVSGKSIPRGGLEEATDEEKAQAAVKAAVALLPANLQPHATNVEVVPKATIDGVAGRAKGDGHIQLAQESLVIPVTWAPSYSVEKSNQARVAHEAAHNLDRSMERAASEKLDNTFEEAEQLYHDLRQSDLMRQWLSVVFAPRYYGRASPERQRRELFAQLAAMHAIEPAVLRERFPEGFNYVEDVYAAAAKAPEYSEGKRTIRRRDGQVGPGGRGGTGETVAGGESAAEGNTQGSGRLEVKESSASGYAERTRENAKADATIAFAVDFDTAGERLTAGAAGKKLVQIHLPLKRGEAAAAIVKHLKALSAKSVNIAGNGMHTISKLAPDLTQERFDKFMLEVLRLVHAEHPIESIRSGGQTGADEAGAKAGVALGIPTTVLMPKGFKTRDATGKDSTMTQAEAHARFGGPAPRDGRGEIKFQGTPDSLPKTPEKITLDMQQLLKKEQKLMSVQQAKDLLAKMDGKELADLAQRASGLTAEQARNFSEAVLGRGAVDAEFTEAPRTDPLLSKPVPPERVAGVTLRQKKVQDLWPHATWAQRKVLTNVQLLLDTAMDTGDFSEADRRIAGISGNLYSSETAVKIRRLEESVQAIDKVLATDARVTQEVQTRQRIGLRDMPNPPSVGSGVGPGQIPAADRASLENEKKGLEAQLRELRNPTPPATTRSEMSTRVARDLGKEGIAVTHDSPHRHEGRLNWRAHVGKGEGNAAVGVGSYVSTDDSVHRHYKNMFTGEREVGVDAPISEGVRELLNSAIETLAIKNEAATGEAIIKEALRIVEARRKPLTGNLFKRSKADEAAAQNEAVKHRNEIEKLKPEQIRLTDPAPSYHGVLNAHPDEIMDWDKPFSEQSADVQRALKSLGIDKGKHSIKRDRFGATLERSDGETFRLVHIKGTGSFNLVNDNDVTLGKFKDVDEAVAFLGGADPTGAIMYRELSKKLGGDHEASDALQKAGLVGHRYAVGAASGRGQQDKSPNYVIYDDSRFENTFVELSSLKADKHRTITDEEKKQVQDYVTKVLGPKMAVEFKRLFDEKGGYHYSGEFLEGGEPPVPKGYTRLYRGEGAGHAGPSTKGGDWFTTDKAKAERFGDVSYVDVNMADKSVMVKFAQGHGGKDEFLTQDAGIKAQVAPLPSGDPLINISIHALNPLSLAFHESLHAFISKLRKEGDTNVQKILANAAASPAVRRQVERLLAGETRALKQIAKPEELLAYAYQFWAAGKLTVGPETRSVFQKITDFIRKVTGFLSEDQKAEAIMQAFHDGKLTEPGSAAKVLASLEARQNQAKAVKAWLQPTIDKANELFSTSEGLLMDYKNPALKRIAEMFNNDTLTTDKRQGFMQAKAQKMGQYMNKLERIVRGFERKDLDLALEALQTDTVAADPVARKIQLQVRALLDEMHPYLKKAGVQRFDPETGEYRPIARVKHYFPRAWDVEALVAKGAQFVADMVKHHGKEMQALADEANAAMAAEAKVTGATLDPNKAATPEKMATTLLHSLIERKGQDDLKASTNSPGFTPFMQAVNRRALGFIDQKVFVGYQNKDLVNIMSSYIAQGVKRAEYSTRFGPDGDILQDMLLNALQFEAHKIGGPKALEQAFKIIQPAQRAVMAMEGVLGHDIDPKWRRISSALMVYQNMRVLPLSLFSSLIDPLGIIVNGGTVNDAFAAFKRGMNEVYKGWKGDKSFDDETKLAELIGTVDSSTYLDALGETYSSVYMHGLAKKINDGIFKWNGMEAWNRAMRVQATQSAISFIKRHKESPNQHSLRYLKELGLEPDDVQIENGKLKLTKGDGLSDTDAAHMQAAVMRWVDRSILRPNAAQRPAWASDPHYGLFFHLKQFTYSFHKVILARAMHEAKNGNYDPMMTMGFMYVPMMIAADVAKGMLQTVGGEPSWKKGWGVGDYVANGIQRAGLLGIPQIGFDVMNYGPDALAGPSVEQVTSAVSDPIGTTAVKALPGSPLFREFLSPTAAATA